MGKTTAGSTKTCPVSRITQTALSKHGTLNSRKLGIQLSTHSCVQRFICYFASKYTQPTGKKISPLQDWMLSEKLCVAVEMTVIMIAYCCHGDGGRVATATVEG